MSDEREIVQIGVDLRPIPLKVGEEVWMFNPDPDVQFFSTLEKVGTALESEGDDRWEAVNTMRDILSSALMDEAQVEAFKKRNYGFAVLAGISRAYTQQVVGTPTQSSSPSGGGQRPRGGRK